MGRHGTYVHHKAAVRDLYDQSYRWAGSGNQARCDLQAELRIDLSSS